MPPGRPFATSLDAPSDETLVRPRPHGLGIAVVFDWALTAQLTTQAIASATRNLGFTPNPFVIGGGLVAAAGLFALGEGLRRGVPCCAWYRLD